MINLEKSREIRIKRANTDWWIHEQAMVGNNGKTYIAYCTDMGEIHVKEIDAKCSRAIGRDVYNGGVIDLASLDAVYESPVGTTCRLLSVAPTAPYRVGFASFELDKPETICYWNATYRDSSWQISEPIADGGEFLSPATMRDGSQTYVGGMAYYYGVGEAGLHPNDPTDTETNRIYIARFDGSNRVLESYLSQNGGKSYRLEQVIRKIAKEKNVKIWRPTVPIYAQDNLPVYWHEGTYGAHTGGWHCDAVMTVEYDD
ncbi:MAG: hypothetical protein IJW92_09160 [Clostridia bacterium]|nr:hypothetical protein [Clostridia bacterium]